MKKFIRILFSVLGILVLVLALAWTVVDAAKYILYKDYFALKRDVCTIPDLNNGFTPQGITYVSSTKGFLHSGYNGSNLALYYVNGEDVRSFVPLNENGDPAKSHGGGVTNSFGFVYVTDDDGLLVYDLDTILKAQNGDSLPCLMRIPVACQASFCSSYNDMLIVGEFYRAGNYETDPAHAYTTPNGDENRAIACFYTIDPQTGTLSKAPEFCVSLPGLVQGMVYDGTSVAISRSWGLNSSSLEIYSNIVRSDATVRCNDTDIPLYYLSEECRKIALPAFSEDLDLMGNRVIVSFESACNKYIIGKLFFAFEVQSYPMAVIPDGYPATK